MTDNDGLQAIRSLPTQTRRKTYEHVYRALRHGLISGRIPQGTHLVETELATQLGVSRTPVRDALRRLESDGFVARGTAGGLWSRGIGPDEIQDLFLDGKRNEAAAAVPDALIDEISLIGPPARIRDRLQAWQDIAKQNWVGSLVLVGADAAAMRVVAEAVL